MLQTLFRSNRSALMATQRNTAALMRMPMRSFALTKYKFDEEDWEPNKFQVSLYFYSKPL